MDRIPVSTKAIILNFMKESGKDYIAIDRLQDFLNFLYGKLFDLNKLNQYEIVYNLWLEHLERMVFCGSMDLALDLDKETILLRHPIDIEILVDDYPINECIISIMREYIGGDNNGRRG